MSTIRNDKGKGVLEKIARRAMQAYGFLPDFSTEALTDTQVKVLVAIADVTVLVKKNSAIDAHARQNTTSVYTTGKIFPMLPEKLSTDLTSLNYHEDRPAMIVGLKYMVFVFRANNRGEGGVIALTALIRGQNTSSESRRRLGVIALGLFAACLLYGDGMITPAISVLSAVEGIAIITPVFDPYVILLTSTILLGLFLIQRYGTARVGGIFGPVILVWLCFLAVTGAAQIVRGPQVLSAVFPWHAIRFLILNKLHGFVVLGAVFLVVTGTEALYADMGHFGIRPIRLTWFALVFPALVLNYFGQGALLLGRPETAHHPFYAMAPSWAMVPTVLLTTLATIIASQAVISGAFSMTRQAIQLGYLPRLNIRQTSATQIGQIYVAPVNWMLMICTIALVLGLQSSSKLAAAYGVAVTSTMLITTTLFFIVARHGFMENPNLDTVLTLARGQGLDLKPESTSFYVGRENLVIGENSSMARWRASLFIFMSRNAADATSFFSLPADQVIEVGVRMAI